EGQEDRVADRVRGHRDHDEHRRGDQHEPQPALGLGALRQLRPALLPGRPAGLGAGNGLGGSAHGTSPFDWRALVIWPVIDATVPDGLIPEGGEMRCEMSIDTTW